MNDKQKAQEVARNLLEKLGPAPSLREVIRANDNQQKPQKGKR